jgi:formamidase
MSSFFNVAMVQIKCDLTNGDLESRKAAQKAKISRYFDTVLSINPRVDLFVLPETPVSGYDLANWARLAETIPGPTSDYFCQRAREMGKWICPGSIIEKVAGSDDTRNTALLISPAGEIVMRISKRFVPYPFETAVRERVSVFSIPRGQSRHHELRRHSGSRSGAQPGLQRS